MIKTPQGVTSEVSRFWFRARGGRRSGRSFILGRVFLGPGLRRGALYQARVVKSQQGELNASTTKEAEGVLVCLVRAHPAAGHSAFFCPRRVLVRGWPLNPLKKEVIYYLSRFYH